VDKRKKDMEDIVVPSRIATYIYVPEPNNVAGEAKQTQLRTTLSHLTVNRRNNRHAFFYFKK